MNQATAPRIWGVGTARTLRAHWMLCELDVDYEWREIIPRTDTMRNEAFLRLSGRGKVPILEHGNIVIGESGAILYYMAEHYRDHIALAPAPGSAQRAVFDDRCFFTLMELDGPLYVIRRHAGLPEVYGESEVAVIAARDYFVRQAKVAEAWLHESQWAHGNRFSAADILLATCSAWARMVGITLPDRLAAHLEQTRSRQAFGRAYANNFPPAALAALDPTTAR